MVMRLNISDLKRVIAETLIEFEIVKTKAEIDARVSYGEIHKQQLKALIKDEVPEVE
jgi:hypothetical protein